MNAPRWLRTFVRRVRIGWYYTNGGTDPFYLADLRPEPRP